MKKKKRVCIISRESNSKTLDIELLEKELLARGMQVETLTKLLTKERSIKSLGYIGHVFKQMAGIHRADVVVLDTYCIPVSMLPHSSGTKTIQMWHALSAVKKFGWQTVGKADGTSEKVARVMRMHNGYDYVLSASDITAEFFCEAFRVGSDKIVKIGLPRIDYIRKVITPESREKILHKLHDRYPELKDAGKKTILYAPTFHKGEPVDVKGLADAIDPDRYNLIVRLHPIDKASSEHVVKKGVIYEDTLPTYDLLSAADIFISDYSSLVVEASLADKPMYLYTYDADKYKVSTGLNMDFAEEPISGYVFKDARDLAGELEKPYDYDALRKFRERYIDVDTDNCTGQIADFIEDLIK